MEGFPVADEAPEAKGILCFRCGVCCMKYSPRVTTIEAEHIAESLGISLETFLERYTDDSWFEPGYYLLDTQDGACVFLCESEDPRMKLCRIHSIRPQVCREWQAGLEKRECLEGLQKCWGLMVDVSGKLSGPEEKLHEFLLIFPWWGDNSVT